METLHQTALSLSIKQDFLWFLIVLTAGVFFSVWARQENRRTDFPSACGVLGLLLLGLVAWGVFLSPSRMNDINDVPHRWADMLAGMIVAGVMAGWVTTGEKHAALRLFWGAAFLMLGAWRWWFPEQGILALNLLLVPTAWWTLRSNPGVSRVDLIGVVVAMAVAPGAWIYWWLNEPMRSADISTSVLMGGVVMLGVMVVATWRIVRRGWLKLPLFQRQLQLRRGGPFGLAMIFWLGAGLVLAALAGRSTRQVFEQSTVDRLRAYAESFDTSELSQVLQRDWIPAELQVFEQQTGAITRYAFVDPMRELTQTMSQLKRLKGSNPDFSMIEVSTLKAGKEWIVAMPGVAPGFEGIVQIARDETQLGRSQWEARETWIEGPARFSVGDAIVIRSPLRNEEEMLVAWLQASYPIGKWAGLQAQSRMMAFALLAAGAGVGLLLFIRRLRAEEKEEAVREAERQRKANRLKSAFLANVSHELRTPLQSFTGYTDLLLQDPLSPVARSRVEALQRNGELMARLINDLIDIGALDSGSFRLVEKTVQPAIMIAQTVESLRPKAEKKGLRLTSSLSAGIAPWVKCDPERCRQIVLNILSNAIKYTEKGSVRVEVGSEEIAADRVRLRVAVSDTGPGIPFEQQTRIFDPFSRLDRTATVEGVGLGLALSRRLAVRMGGDIVVESTVDRGSTFTATLEVAPDRPPQAERKKASHLEAQRILVVDDNTLVRELFVQGLRLQGAKCTAAADGHEALAKLKVGKFDGMVLDLALPGMEGREVARKVREVGNELRIVGVSAHAGELEREQALQAGMDDFLTKPVNISRLAKAFASRVTPRDDEEIWQQRSDEWGEAFRQELPQRLAGLDQAFMERDWDELFRTAHRLRNSAMVVRDEVIFSSCGDLQEASRLGDEKMIQAALTRCKTSAENWLNA
ncbi:MAG: hypothetical protein SynsKO_28660 [Synoicihabitans sp.]